jgi:hypothetical protein
MRALWDLAGAMRADPLGPRWQLTAFGVDPDTMQLGAIIYAVVAWIGGGLIASLTGRQTSGRLWSLVLLAVGLVPYLALRYPVVFGGVLPWGLLLAFRRWGFWRLVIAAASILMFASILMGRIRYGGYDAGLAFAEALTTTGWLLLLLFLLFVALRTFHHGLGYIGGAVRQEEYRAGRRTETRRFRDWRNRKLQRAGQAVKEGETYKGKHAPGRAGGTSRRGSGGGMTTANSYDPGRGEFEVRGYTPDAHPDPEVRRQFMEGGSGPINGWIFDQYSGLYLRHDPDPDYQLGGGVRLPLHQRIWRRP